MNQPPAGAGGSDSAYRIDLPSLSPKAVRCEALNRPAAALQGIVLNNLIAEFN